MLLGTLNFTKYCGCSQNNALSEMLVRNVDKRTNPPHKLKCALACITAHGRRVQRYKTD
jgi:hypothetical protein